MKLAQLIGRETPWTTTHGKEVYAWRCTRKGRQETAV